jgi:hypothetical protein
MLDEEHDLVAQVPTVENNAFCDMNKTRVKRLNSEYDSTIEDESEMKDKISYTDVVKGKMK